MDPEQQNGKDYSLLTDRIREVFADVPYPGDENIISTPDHVQSCGECSRLYHALVGKRWTELTEDNSSSGYISHAMSFFTAAGWHHYLPAYLIQSINLRRFSSLYFRPSFNAGWNERIKRLSPEQCKMVIAYLLIVLKEDAESQYSVDRNAEVVRYWKGIFESGNLPRQDAG
jgi:hypothetical protein